LRLLLHQQSLKKVSVLLLGGLELVLRYGVFTVFDFHKVGLSLVWCTPTSLHVSWFAWQILGLAVLAGADAKCCPFPLRPAPLLDS
jgi:hypothetical protein